MMVSAMKIFFAHPLFGAHSYPPLVIVFTQSHFERGGDYCSLLESITCKGKSHQ
jgi:hypothetical protein